MFEQIAPYASSFLTVSTIYFIACVSPGPDMAMTIRNTLRYSRKIAMMSVLGTTTGMAMHLTYTLFGIGLLVHEFPWIQDVLKYVGAVWLLYIGYKSLVAKSHISEQINVHGSVKKITSGQAFRLGFFTNALNPFVILLFIGILSNEIDPYTPFWIQGVLGVIMISIGLSWFTFLAMSFSYRPVKEAFLRLGPWLDRATGGILIMFGLKLAFAAVK